MAYSLNRLFQKLNRLSTGEGGRFTKIMIVQKSKWKMHSNESVRTMLLHRGEGRKFLKSIDFGQIKVENALE